MAEPRLCECGCGLATATRFVRGHNGGLNAARGYEAKLSVADDGTRLKLCTSCQQSKPLEDFNRSRTRKEGRRAHCKTCERDQARAHYQKQPEGYLARAAAYRDANRVELTARMLRIKLLHGCRLCIEREPCCLDFHHVLPKARNLGQCLEQVTRFERELVKCVVLCANCHRKVHAGLLTVPLHLLCTAEDGATHH